jgi:hypothetical protein
MAFGGYPALALYDRRNQCIWELHLFYGDAVVSDQIKSLLGLSISQSNVDLFQN